MTQQELKSVTSFIKRALDLRIHTHARAKYNASKEYLKNTLDKEEVRETLARYKETLNTQQRLLEYLEDKLKVPLREKDLLQDQDSLIEILADRMSDQSIHILSTQEIEGFLIARNFDPQIDNIEDYIDELYKYV